MEEGCRIGSVCSDDLKGWAGTTNGLFVDAGSGVWVESRPAVEVWGTRAYLKKRVGGKRAQDWEVPLLIPNQAIVLITCSLVIKGCCTQALTGGCRLMKQLVVTQKVQTE